MPVSEAQKKASARYLETLDEVRIRMPKGKKATIQTHAETQGQSVNAYINAAIDEKMSRAAVGGPTRPVEPLPSETIKAAPAASESRTEGIAATETEE